MIVYDGVIVLSLMALGYKAVEKSNYWIILIKGCEKNG